MSKVAASEAIASMKHGMKAGNMTKKQNTTVRSDLIKRIWSGLTLVEKVT